MDPYEILKEEWILDPGALPSHTYPDIFTYLVCGVSACTAAHCKNNCTLYFKNAIFLKMNFVQNRILCYLISFEVYKHFVIQDVAFHLI